MKKLFLAVAASLTVCGCAALKEPVAQAQKLMSDFCPVVNGDLQILASAAVLNPAQKAMVASIYEVNKKVCEAQGGIDVTSLKALNASAFPALVALVAANPAIPNQPAILLGLTIAQPLLAQLASVLPQ